MKSKKPKSAKRVTQFSQLLVCCLVACAAVFFFLLLLEIRLCSSLEVSLHFEEALP